MATIIERFDLIVRQLCDNNNQKLSSAVGIGESTVRNYRSIKEPNISTVVRICEVFNVSPDWFLLGNGPMLRSEHSEEVKGSEKPCVAQPDTNAMLLEQNIKLQNALIKAYEHNAKLQDMLLKK